MVDIWWGSWLRIPYLDHNIGYFYISLTTPILLYLLAIVIFPGKDLKSLNLSMYVWERFNKIMGMYFLVVCSILLNNWLFSAKPFYRPEILLIITSAILCIAGLLARKKNNQNIVLISGFVIVIAHIILFANSNITIEVENYSREEYLHLFLAIVYGYVASVFFVGWGKLIRNFKIHEVHVYHLLWTIFAFIIFADIWWSTWNKIHLIPSNIGYFYVILLQPFLYYFLANQLFHVLEDKKSSLEEKFRLATPAIFVPFGLVFIMNISLSVIFEEFGLFHSKNLFRFLGFIFAMVAVVKKSRIYQIFILCIAFLLYIIHLIVDEF